MLIAPSTLESARARRLDLEREARHERLVRLARTTTMGCGLASEGACCPNGCCDLTDVGAPTCAPTCAAA